MKKLNRVIIIVSRIVEVFMWVGCGLSAVITALSAAGKLDLIHLFTDATPGTELTHSRPGRGYQSQAHGNSLPALHRDRHLP